MPDFLARMAQRSERRAAEARRSASEKTLRERVRDLPDCPELQLHPGGFDIIAEVKRSSPSAGTLREVDGGFIGRQTESYVRGGAAAVSVLTEPDEFHGSLDDLTVAARAVPIPIMRKDFLVDPYQIVEARVAGAAGALLILRILEDARAVEMIEAAAEMGMFVLLEAFDEAELARAARLAHSSRGRGVQVLVGLNSRDLTTLEVDEQRLERLAPAFPSELPRVAESGLQSAEDVARIASLGYTAALVGSALMTSPNPTQLTAAMIQAGREEAMRCESE
jgi:indole-3-glycerol phosphate synthase